LQRLITKDAGHTGWRLDSERLIGKFIQIIDVHSWQKVEIPGDPQKAGWPPADHGMAFFSEETQSLESCKMMMRPFNPY
jgi:hypothetical protein